jgi:uncharacterized membrane protein
MKYDIINIETETVSKNKQSHSATESWLIMTKKNTSDVSCRNYNEAAALQQLLQSIDAALEDSNERIEQLEDYSGQFTININGQSIAFLLGGPQVAALQAFVSHVADENFYDVDFAECTVIE